MMMNTDSPTTDTLDVTQTTANDAPSAAEAMESTEPPVELTLEEQVQAASLAYQELHNQYLRLAADFENFRKRRMNELEQQQKYGAEPFVLALLPVLDNLERANKSFNDATPSTELLKGLHMMNEQLRQCLEGVGVKRCHTEGGTFNAQLHEAVSTLVVPGVPEHQIIGEQQAGYYLHDKLIRVPQVIVAASAEG
jgi:molecular chaperone GrpE